jgi:hypothetical protein
MVRRSTPRRRDCSERKAEPFPEEEERGREMAKQFSAF